MGRLRGLRSSFDHIPLMTISIGPPTWVARPPAASTTPSSTTLAAPTLQFRIPNPLASSGAPPDIVKLVNQDQHLFVVWTGNSLGSDLAALYSVTGDGTPIWTQSLTGYATSISWCWDAKATDDFLVIREDATSSGSQSPELSKWDVATGRKWTSSAIRFDVTQGAGMHAGGIASDGVRSVIVGINTASPNGHETHLLEGSDDTITTTLGVGSNTWASHAAVSRDGEHMIRADFQNHVIHNIETDTVTHASASGGYAFPASNPGWMAISGVAISGDGAEAILLDTTTNTAKLFVWGGASYTVTTFGLPGEGYGVDISNDGTKAVAISRTGPGSLGIVTFDVATAAINTAYSVTWNDPQWTSARPTMLRMADDGSTYGFACKISANPGQGPQHIGFRAKTSETTWQPVCQAPEDHYSLRSDFGTLGTYMAVGYGSSSVWGGHVALYNLP